MRLLVKCLLFLFLPVWLFATGDISGTVTDTSLTPISGATVNLYKNQVLIDSTTTVLNGTYSFTSISPGNHDIQASATLHQTETQGVNVKNNQTVVVDFALSPNPGSITGTVTDADTTLPISGANITVTQNSIIVATTTTNGLGIYNVTGIVPGSCVVIAEATNYQTGVLGGIVTSNETITVDFALEIDPGTLSGTVTSDSSSLPIEGATVEIHLGASTLFSTLTIADGTYSISGIAPGSYTVHAHADTYQTAIAGAIITAGATTTTDFALILAGGTLIGTVTSASTGAVIVGALIDARLDDLSIDSALTDSSGQYLIENLPPDAYTIHAQAVDYQVSLAAAAIEIEGITNVNFSLLSNPGTVSGTVVSTATGLPISGATVEVVVDHFSILTAVTNNSGQYLLTGIFSGNFEVHAQANSYQTAVIEAALSAGIVNTINFSLSSNPATITGTVTAASSGDPIPATLIEVHHPILDLILTDSSGNYTITGLPTGSFSVHAHHHDYQTKVKKVTLAENTTTFVDFSLASDPSVVSGTIRDAITGLPLPGAFVFVSISGDVVLASALTLSDGTYSLGGLFPETFVVCAQKTQYITRSTSPFVVSSGGESLTQNLSLYPIDVPPTNLSGDVLVNRLILQMDRIHRLTWQPSVSPEVTEYRIYRNGQVIKNIGASTRPLVYDDHNRSAKTADLYVVTSINSDGSESSGLSISLK